MRMWWAPGRGASSIMRTPDCFNSAMRSSRRSTVRATWCRPSPRFSMKAATVLVGSHVSNAEEADADLLTGHVLAALEDGPEGAFVEGPLGVDGADGDADVVDCL